MNSLKQFIKSEVSNWKLWEILFLVFSCIFIIIVSLISGDTFLGIISSTTGVAYTVCNGKGKRVAYFFGLINSVLYAYISFNAQVYGDAALYGIYYVPAMIVGFFAWKNHISSTNLEVSRQKLKRNYKVLLCAVCLTGTIGLGLILKYLTNDPLPFLDAFTTFISIIATILAIKRYSEQWLLWTSVNLVEVILWVFRTIDGVENASISLIMWILFLLIGIVMWIKWIKEIRL